MTLTSTKHMKGTTSEEQVEDDIQRWADSCERERLPVLEMQWVCGAIWEFMYCEADPQLTHFSEFEW